VLARQEHTREVDVDRAPPDREREPVGAVVLAGELHARVCDDHVQAAPGRRRPLDRRGNLVLTRDVRGQDERLAAAGLDLGGHATRARFPASMLTMASPSVPQSPT
jgi:hypothetical protein